MAHRAAPRVVALVATFLASLVLTSHHVASEVHVSILDGSSRSLLASSPPVRACVATLSPNPAHVPHEACDHENPLFKGKSGVFVPVAVVAAAHVVLAVDPCGFVPRAPRLQRPTLAHVRSSQPRAPPAR